MDKVLLVIDPATGDIVNRIVVDPAAPVAIEGYRLVEDEWGAGPGDRWDAAARRAVRVERPAEPQPPQELLAARARLDEAEQAWRAGDSARFSRALSDAQAAIAGLSAPPKGVPR